MPEVFADTAGWANFFVRTEPFHVQAAQLIQHRHITTACTTDHHFEQAGFIKKIVHFRLDFSLDSFRSSGFCTASSYGTGYSYSHRAVGRLKRNVCRQTNDLIDSFQ
jgi:hypothetical protein